MAKAKRTQKIIAKSDRHGWISTEKVKTRFGTFEFKNGYPTLALRSVSRWGSGSKELLAAMKTEVALK
jgi:hypothetical protein